MKSLTSQLLLILNFMFGFALSNFTHATDITVSAAASLSDAFREIATRYEAKYPQDTIYLNFAGSGALLQQILHGAPVDVFAPADQWRMTQAEQQGFILENSQHFFATNTLVVIVPVSDESNYDSLSTLLASDSIQHIAIANPEHVPAGRYTQQALQAQNLWTAAQAKQIPSQNVRQALDYVMRAEVDAGFVYKTDALIAADSVRQVLALDTPEPITYPIALLKQSEQITTAQRFIDFVLSDEGQEVLKAYGFQSVHETTAH